MTDYVANITEIKRTATRVKTILDTADPEASRFSAQAINNAKSRLARIQQELTHLEQTLNQYVKARPKPQRKAGPAETKRK
jgi:hypothetical protein